MSGPGRYVCVHGHFYQPPRENPWLETVERQDSAHPYHDWNERVTAEAYAPNAAARILDGRDRIVRIVNNYARISFNFGPTLLSWLEGERPDVYAAVLEADRLSAERFSGHGSAMAQAHSHLILPLATRRDKETQILWGIRDFEHRFGRAPEGMWLPETAVDTESLDLMAEHGIRFTVLAPHQATGARPLYAPREKAGADPVDPTRPYLCRLPSGRSIALFLYDGTISRSVAFEKLLADGERFARRLLSGFDADRPAEPQLVHIATDGETYGHHHRHGEMALAYALDRLEREGSVRLTNYGEHLERHPPTREVEIVEGTSWSCVHGVERWRSDCGCRTGGEPGWSQAWRGPLRSALDRLRDELDPLWEEAASELLGDPWAARNDYVEVVFDRSPERLEAFLARHARDPEALTEEERTRIRYLLEIERHALYMLTSCGWFFNDLAGIETVQILLYAGRALQLAGRVLGPAGLGLEERFLERLEAAESNRPPPRGGTGRQIYEREVLPARVDLTKVAAHYALSTLWEEYPEQARIFCYRADQRSVRIRRSGRAQLAVGRLRVTSLITGTGKELSFAVLHFGDHHINGGVRAFRSEEAFEAMADEVEEAFDSADFARVLRLLDRYFEELTYSLDSLFRDERRAVLDLILESTRTEAEAHHRAIYEDHEPLMRYLADLRIPLPRELGAAAEVILDLELRRAFESPDGDLDQVERRLAETESWDLSLDTEGLAFTIGRALEERAARLAAAERGGTADLDLLLRLERTAGLARSLPFPVPLGGAQNAVYRMLRTDYPERSKAAAAGEREAAAWVEVFASLAEKLNLRVDPPAGEGAGEPGADSAEDGRRPAPGAAAEA